MRQFACYLSGENLIYSDHEPLIFISKLSSLKSKLLRWSLELTPYSIIVKHIKGSNNCFADFLSRPGSRSSSKDEGNACKKQLLNSDGNFITFNVNYTRVESQIS